MAKKNVNKPKIDVKVETFTRQLRVILTEHELAERADRAAHVLSDRDGKEESRKAANTAAKSQIEELEAELRRLSCEIRDKAKYDQVECERRYDYRTGRVVEKRIDTGSVLHERAMNEAERQLELGLDEKPATNGKPEAQKLGDAVVDNEPPLPTQKRGKAKGNGRGKGRSTEARA